MLLGHILTVSDSWKWCSKLHVILLNPFFAMPQVAYKMLEAQQATLSHTRSASSLPDDPQTDESTAREGFSLQDSDDVGLTSSSITHAGVLLL